MRRKDDRPELDEFGEERGEDEGLRPEALARLVEQTRTRTREEALGLAKAS